MSKFKQREMLWSDIYDYETCIESNIMLTKENLDLKRRVELAESKLTDASFREWAEAYDSWYSSQINYDLLKEYDQCVN